MEVHIQPESRIKPLHKRHRTGARTWLAETGGGAFVVARDRAHQNATHRSQCRRINLPRFASNAVAHAAYQQRDISMQRRPLIDAELWVKCKKTDRCERILDEPAAPVKGARLVLDDGATATW